MLRIVSRCLSLALCAVALCSCSSIASLIGGILELPFDILKAVVR